jgi:hypothetical protein
VSGREEPMHCGQPMVHNSFTGEYECADAYFTLLDEGALSATREAWKMREQDWSPEQLSDRDVPSHLLDILRHWRASRISDEPHDARTTHATHDR